MLNPQDLLARNRRWAAEIKRHDSHFFQRLAKQQKPRFLWIGCSDSRVPANEIVDLTPGEVFVHRNVANLVVHTDLNCLSVLQYAVEALRVRHIIVCGHYGCGGVRAAMGTKEFGLIDNWLEHIRDVRRLHQAELAHLADEDARCDRLCELNVGEQVVNVCRTTTVQNAWRRGRRLTINGWIYRISDGLIRDLGLVVERPEQIPEPTRGQRPSRTAQE
jgi:carbonic anhydrase